MTTETTIGRAPRRLKTRRIIERPRLFALLDASSARLKTLVAPAGYGKTTLAEQWVARDGRRSAWFTARHSSTDVAALALGIAEAAKALVPDCDVRLREHLRALPAPADVRTIAEILGEDLASWPEDGWLVIDEYDEIARGASSERLVAMLIELAPVQVLIASRQRPAWISARDILYGDYLELGQSALSMDSSEAAQVLADEQGRVASGLVALADGWPAVIGLAAVAGADVDRDVEQVPESLYRFFADEVYLALPEVVRAGLAQLAAAPVLDDELVVELLGTETAATVRDAAVEVGILVERGSCLDLHPLCRSFLEERSEQLGLVPTDESLMRCLEHYRARRDWDAAFDLIDRRGLFDQLEGALRDALDEFLDTARLSTIEEWCRAAPRSDLDRPLFLVARAEVSLRRGRYTMAQSLAEAAAVHCDSDLVFRALSVAARSAHLASREEEGLELYRRAEAVARDETERRDALWGQLMCASDLELPTCDAMYLALLKGVRRSDARDTVRAAACGLAYSVKFGKLSLAGADSAYELLERVSDPLVVSSFQSTYSVALALSAMYDEAYRISAEFLSTSEQYRLDFARPYALCSFALASVGLRHWGRARAALEEAHRLARKRKDSNAGHLAHAQLLRLFAQRGRYGSALALETPSLEGALNASRAEVLLSRALVLACAGRVDEALALTDKARTLSRAVEPRVLVAAVEAVSAVRSRDRNMLERLSALELAAFDSGGVDLLVTTYRACPELLPLLLKVTVERDRLHALLRRARDADLAASVGYSVSPENNPLDRLTAREREIYEFLLRGVSNQEIAEALYISRATAKRHVQNIYNKLGLRSRAAIAVQAALARSSQATAATEASPSSDSSSRGSRPN